MRYTRSSTPAVYPVNDTTVPAAERAYLETLAQNAATQDLTQDLGSHVRNLSVSFTIFAVVFVGLRFLARHRQAARIGADDWLILLSLAVLVGNMIMNLMLIHQGLGLHSGALTLPELQRLDQTIVGAEIIYVIGVNMYKISLLLLYFRVFPLRVVRLGGYICGGLSTAWCVACVLAATFQCTPRERLWKPWIEGSCINQFLTQLCISIPSILCDIVILCLPMPHVLRLKTTRTQRFLLMVIFLLGSYVVFTSIYRFRTYLLYTADDVPYSLADGCAWNVIEISSGIVSTCLPTLGPLIRDLFKSAWPSSHGGSKGVVSRAAGGGSSAVMTIGGTRRKINNGSALKTKSTRWNRLTDSDEALARPGEGAKYGIEDDLELVPRHMAGQVEVNVRASPVSGSTGRKSGKGDSDEDEEASDMHSPNVIRQRIDVQWSVEERAPATATYHGEGS